MAKPAHAFSPLTDHAPMFAHVRPALDEIVSSNLVFSPAPNARPEGSTSRSWHQRDCHLKSHLRARRAKSAFAPAKFTRTNMMRVRTVVTIFHIFTKRKLGISDMTDISHPSPSVFLVYVTMILHNHPKYIHPLPYQLPDCPFRRRQGQPGQGQRRRPWSRQRQRRR